jgi:hypothetical protein
VEEEAPKFQQLESSCYVTCKVSSFKFSSSTINPCRGGASRIELKTFLPKRTHTHTHKLITKPSKQTKSCFEKHSSLPVTQQRQQLCNRKEHHKCTSSKPTHTNKNVIFLSQREEEKWKITNFGNKTILLF